MVELYKYVCSLDVDQEELFNAKFNYRSWRKVCKEAELPDLKLHGLRKTFCSLLAQNGVFDCYYTEIIGALFIKSDKQGIYEC